MSSIMNNLLDVRKIEEGKMRIRSKPISLSKLIDSTHSMMKPLVRQGVDFKTVKVLPEGRNWVLGDEHRIQQVLTNVITNAIKYTLHGSITLSVFWQDHFVVLECEDTGPGIPKSEHERMFERFVQRGGAPGTGLGLNIAQKIVNMMDGSIGFDSDPTIAPGTTCRIMLPLLLCAEPDDMSLCQNSKGVEMIEDPINIMIIDDIRMNRTMLSRRINKAIAPNATITLAETAEEALDLCESIEFDVIICDQYMEEAGGVMVGTDAIIAMRRMNVRSYIIGCSGNDLDNEFYDAGANMVWGKPLPPNGEIIQQLKRGLEERRAFEESAL
jgi:CheY-like chemotaxis protein